MSHRIGRGSYPRQADDGSWGTVYYPGFRDENEGPSGALIRCQSPDSMYFDPPPPSSQVSAPMNYGAACAPHNMLAAGGFANMCGTVMANMSEASPMAMPSTNMVAVPAILMPPRSRKTMSSSSSKGGGPVNSQFGNSQPSLSTVSAEATAPSSVGPSAVFVDLGYLMPSPSSLKD
mmetsp:Transcript_29279/g.68142  ORF Transcript_29279/g.68142 Transcript_29279/m.68142 type:complete len:176 (+) Transcript_29279:79-606(+)